MGHGAAPALPSWRFGRFFKSSALGKRAVPRPSEAASEDVAGMAALPPLFSGGGRGAPCVSITNRQIFVHFLQPFSIAMPARGSRMGYFEKADATPDGQVAQLRSLPTSPSSIYAKRSLVICVISPCLLLCLSAEAHLLGLFLSPIAPKARGK